MESLYDVLRIRIDANDGDILNAIEKADGNVQPGLLNAAKHILLNPVRRSEYDERLRDSLDAEQRLMTGGVRRKTVGNY